MFHRFFIFLSFLLLFSECAQIVPLTGGEKDTSPPDLISVMPSDLTKNFKAEIILFKFNERIQLKNPGDNIIIVPATDTKPKWKVNKKELEITLPPNLNPNTTYKLIFNKAIADLTESNAIDYLEYVFSTGEIIDSNFIKGTVYNAFTHAPENNVLIGLYDATKSDSVIYQEKPLYFTKSKSDGSYKINYLPNQNFKIIAIADGNNNFTYDPFKEKLGFLNQAVNPTKDSVVDFFITEEKPIKSLIKKIIQPTAQELYIIYNKPNNYQLLNNQSIAVIQNKNPSDTCKIFHNANDSLYFIIKTATSQDTIKTPLLYKKKPLKQLQLSGLISNAYPYYAPINLYANFWMDTSYIKTNIKLFLKSDSINALALKNIQITPYEIKIYTPLRQNEEYVLEGLLKSINPTDSIKKQKIKFKTNSAESYARLNINILFPEKKNYIIALCDQQHKIIYSQTIDIPFAASNKQSVEFKNILPNNYVLKIISDENKNNIWESHNYLNKTAFEKVFVYPKTIKINNNWDINIDWNDVK